MTAISDRDQLRYIAGQAADGTGDGSGGTAAAATNLIADQGADYTADQGAAAAGRAGSTGNLDRIDGAVAHRGGGSVVVGAVVVGAGGVGTTSP